MKLARPTAAETAIPPAKRAGRSALEERHPAIANAILLMWGYPELNAYFDKLWLTDGTQTPIDPEAMSDLMLLSRVHQVLVPQRPARSLESTYSAVPKSSKHDVWDEVPRRR